MGFSIIHNPIESSSALSIFSGSDRLGHVMPGNLGTQGSLFFLLHKPLKLVEFLRPSHAPITPSSE